MRFLKNVFSSLNVKKFLSFFKQLVSFYIVKTVINIPKAFRLRSFFRSSDRISTFFYFLFQTWKFFLNSLQIHRLSYFRFIHETDTRVCNHNLLVRQNFHHIVLPCKLIHNYSTCRFIHNEFFCWIIKVFYSFATISSCLFFFFRAHFHVSFLPLYLLQPIKIVRKARSPLQCVDLAHKVCLHKFKHLIHWFFLISQSSSPLFHVELLCVEGKLYYFANSHSLSAFYPVSVCECIAHIIL